MQQGLRHRLYLDTRLRFDKPLRCDLTALESVVDCYSSGPEGFWPVKPKLAAPIERYEACLKLLRQHPEYETVHELITSVSRRSNGEK